MQRSGLLLVIMVGACGAPQSGGPTSSGRTTCDANGHWILSHTVGAGDCMAAEDYGREFDLVHRPNGDANILHNPDTDELLVNVADVRGECIVEIRWDSNIIAHGTPDIVRYEYKLTERDGQVSGSGVYLDLDESAPMDEQRIACSQPFTVRGSVKR